MDFGLLLNGLELEWRSFHKSEFHDIQINNWIKCQCNVAIAQLAYDESVIYVDEYYNMVVEKGEYYDSCEL